jgi:glycosyltransferase involved in cell wall biosynthesis
MTDMFEKRRIGVVVPAHNEEKLIGKVLETMPPYVDKIIVVDDASADETKTVVRRQMSLDPRIILMEHRQNHGVGATIVSGYKRALQENLEVVAVMAGDGQMAPEDLPRVLAPVATGEADYTKGNRLFRGESWEIIPHYRYLGNSMLSLLTKIASGYWHIADSQSGYTAISRTALERIRLDSIYPGYGMPNDILIKLNIHNFKVRDVSIRPVYNQGERSGIRLSKVIPRISWLLCKGFFRRLFEKYVIRDFHPLIFFYLLGLLLLPPGLILGFYLVSHRLLEGPVSATSALFAAFLTISGLQAILFAMWFDMDYNRDLR